MQEEARRRSSMSPQTRLNFGPECETSPSCYQKETRWPPVFTRIGRKAAEDEASDSQYSEEYEDNGRRTNVHARLGNRKIQDRLGRQRSSSESSSRSGSRRIHDRLGRQASPSESPPSSDSEEKQCKRRKRENSSSSDSSDNEDKEIGQRNRTLEVQGKTSWGRRRRYIPSLATPKGWRIHAAHQRLIG